MLLSHDECLPTGTAQKRRVRQAVFPTISVVTPWQNLGRQARILQHDEARVRLSVAESGQPDQSSRADPALRGDGGDMAAEDPAVSYRDDRSKAGLSVPSTTVPR